MLTHLISDRAERSPVPRVCLGRAIRDFGDGFAAVLLPVHLTAVGLSAFEVGLVATSALLGSALLTLALGLFASGYDRRTLLVGAAALMAATGLAYAGATAYWAIVLVAAAGTINPSAGSTSVFVPLEHSVVSNAATPAGRTAAFARYGLIGSLAAATGSLAVVVPDWIAAHDVAASTSFRIMFAAYAALGVLAAFVYGGIPRQPPGDRTAAPPLGQSRRVVYRLAALFSLDAFAGGFIVQSLLALWLFDRFALSLTAAGAFFFWTGLLAAFSFPAAAWLARRIGLVNTMVFTHIPASLCLIGAAFAPSLEWVLVLLSCRAVLGLMDVPARASYVMAVVTAAERPAAASVTAVPRSLASALSPAIAGALFAAGLQIWPLVLCGALKIVYDVLLLVAFRDLKPPEERADPS